VIINFNLKEYCDMQNTTLARKAGMIGMVGSVLWVITVIMQSSFALYGPDSGWLWVFHQLLVFTAFAGVIIGFLGLIWGGAVSSGFGKTAVYIYVISWALIIIAGLVMLFLPNEESPIFILFPIGGTLQDIGALLTGVAVLIAKRWSGWQRFVPIANFVIVFFGVNLPSFLGATDGPGMIGEFIMGICWFGVALAVYTADERVVSHQPSAIS
jgi:hypothetical protein